MLSNIFILPPKKESKLLHSSTEKKWTVGDGGETMLFMRKISRKVVKVLINKCQYGLL